MKHTKIVATISDLRCDVDFLTELYNAGMNVVRMNTAHIDEDGFSRLINNARAVSSKLAILVDTKGPEIRTTKTSDGENISFSTGDIVNIYGDPTQLSSKENVYLSYTEIVKDLSVGLDILFDDGEIDMKVIEKKGDHLVCEVQNEGKLGSRKSVNVPGVRINLPSLTEKDKKNIDLAIKFDVDFIAHSFVRNKQDILDIQEILDKQKSEIKIIAKIENQEGVDNIDEILEVAYGVMVARGDLGIEVPQEKIPAIQRHLIRRCINAKKPVIVATQMLHTMITNPRPTRAEVTDVANAIYYRTDAIMLSGETAYGKYPIEAVRTMAKIAEEAENSKDPDGDIKVHFNSEHPDTTAFLAEKATKASAYLNTKAIVTDSLTGRTARYLAAFRSKNPVLAVCYKERTMRELALSYGVFASHQEAPNGDSRQYLLEALKDLCEKGKIQSEDYISYLSGSFGAGTGTTFLEINQVGKILDEKKKYVLPNF